MDVNVNVEDILEKYQPIIIVYYPYIYQGDKGRAHIASLKKKFEDIFGKQYFVFFISTAMEEFKMEILSVLKSKFIEDSDLKKYLNAINDEHMKEFDKYAQRISSKLKN